MPGTTIKAFQEFIKTLPDKGSGLQGHYEWPKRMQTYLGRMTREEAELVNLNPIVEGIGPNRIKRISYGRSNAGSNKQSLSSSKRRANATRLLARDEPPWVIEQRDESELHLRMISCTPEGRLRDLQANMRDDQYDYRFEETLGKGATIYVMDEGFEFEHQVNNS